MAVDESCKTSFCIILQKKLVPRGQVKGRVFMVTDHLMRTNTKNGPEKMAAVTLGSGCVGPGLGQDLVDFFLHEPKHQKNIELEYFRNGLVLCQ